MGDGLDLIDRIYEAGVVTETWADVLDTLSRKYGCTGGVLFAYGATGTHSWICTPPMRPLLEEFIRDGWAALNQKPQRISALNYCGFINDLDVFTPEEIERDRVYSEFYPSRDLGWAAGAMIPVPSGDTLIFSFERAFRKGPFEDTELVELDALRPHLARAALWSSRLALQKVQAMMAALDTVGLPAAVLRAGGKLHAANAGFQQLLPAVAMDAPRRLVLINRGADILLRDTLERLVTQGASGQSRSIAIAASETNEPMIAHVFPVRGAANDIFLQGLAVLIITPVNRKAVPTAEVLQGLFDLTPAEARVAQGIAEGQSVNALAASGEVSRETIRTQLAAALAKTGTSRQAELVSLLSGKALPPVSG